MSVLKERLLAAALNQLVHECHILPKDDVQIEEAPYHTTNATYEKIQGSMLIFSKPHIDVSYIGKLQHVNKDTKIFIVGLDERRLPMMVDLNGRVEDVKRDIAQNYHGDPYFMRLIYGSKQLESDKPLTYYGIRCHSITTSN